MSVVIDADEDEHQRSVCVLVKFFLDKGQERLVMVFAILRVACLVVCVGGLFL